MYLGSHSKPVLRSLLPLLKRMRDDVLTTGYRDAMEELILLVAEVVTSPGDSVEILTTEK